MSKKFCRKHAFQDLKKTKRGNMEAKDGAINGGLRYYSAKMFTIVFKKRLENSPKTIQTTR